MTKDLREFEIPENKRERLKDHGWLRQELEKGKTAQAIVGFTDATMNQFYAAALHLFEQKRFQDALNAFLFLITLNPYHYDYWLGLGAATQWCGDYEAAIDSYEMAAICQLENPEPYFHLARCLFAMHDRASALQAIELAIEYSDGRSRFDELHRQALAAKNLILKEQ